MTTEPKLLPPEQLEEIAARDAEFAEDLPPPHRMNSHTGGIVVHDRRALLSHVAALEARVAELESDEAARRKYYVTAHVMGFVNSPMWHELNEDVRKLYRDAALASGGGK